MRGPSLRCTGPIPPLSFHTGTIAQGDFTMHSQLGRGWRSRPQYDVVGADVDGVHDAAASASRWRCSIRARISWPRRSACWWRPTHERRPRWAARGMTLGGPRGILHGFAC